MEDRFPGFVRRFFSELYAGEMGKVPGWAVEALRGVGVELGEGKGEREGGG